MKVMYAHACSSNEFISVISGPVPRMLVVLVAYQRKLSDGCVEFRLTVPYVVAQAKREIDSFTVGDFMNLNIGHNFVLLIQPQTQSSTNFLKS